MFTLASLKILEHSDKPSFLQAEQTQFSWPFLTWHASQSFDHLCGPSVDPLQLVHNFFV